VATSIIQQNKHFLTVHGTVALNQVINRWLFKVTDVLNHFCGSIQHERIFKDTK